MSEQILLNLVFPPSLSDPLIDWLLEQPEVQGFISLPIKGHGGAEERMSAAEKVAGYRKGVLIQTHLPLSTAQQLLDKLKQDFAGSDIHYWLSPVIQAGHLE